MISIRIDYDSHYQKNQCTITHHETIIFEIVANTALGSPDPIFCRLKCDRISGHYIACSYRVSC